jgi:hypothetical protein
LFLGDLNPEGNFDDQMDKYASRFKSASGQEFKRTRYSEINTTQLTIMSQHNRSERYVDFDQMEYTPEIASALDIYADEMTTHSSLANAKHCLPE